MTRISLSTTLAPPKRLPSPRPARSFGELVQAEVAARKREREEGADLTRLVAEVAERSPALIGGAIAHFARTALTPGQREELRATLAAYTTREGTS